MASGCTVNFSVTLGESLPHVKIMVEAVIPPTPLVQLVVSYLSTIFEVLDGSLHIEKAFPLGRVKSQHPSHVLMHSANQSLTVIALSSLTARDYKTSVAFLQDAPIALAGNHIYHLEPTGYSVWAMNEEGVTFLRKKRLPGNYEGYHNIPGFLYYDESRKELFLADLSSRYLCIVSNPSRITSFLALNTGLANIIFCRKLSDTKLVVVNHFFKDDRYATTTIALFDLKTNKRSAAKEFQGFAVDVCLTSTTTLSLLFRHKGIHFYSLPTLEKIGEASRPHCQEIGIASPSEIYLWHHHTDNARAEGEIEIFSTQTLTSVMKGRLSLTSSSERIMSLYPIIFNGECFFISSYQPYGVTVHRIKPKGAQDSGGHKKVATTQKNKHTIGPITKMSLKK